MSTLTRHSSNERRVVCVSWLGFTVRALVSCIDKCLGLWNSHRGDRCIIQRRMRSLILGIGGTDTQIDGYLTHKLRVRHDIFLNM
jgi:hypothetical protein